MKRKVVLSRRILFWISNKQGPMKSIPMNMRKRRESSINFDGKVECVRNGHINKKATEKEVNKDLPENIKMAGWDKARKVK